MAKLTTLDIQRLEAATLAKDARLESTMLSPKAATMSAEEWQAVESDASSVAELILREHGWTWTTLLEIDPDLQERLSDWHVAHVAQRYEKTGWYWQYQRRAIAAFTELVRYHAPE